MSTEIGYIAIGSENTINFGKSIWTSGKCISIDGGHYIIANRNEKIKIGERYVMQLSRHDYSLMEPCSDADEAERCNDNSNIGRSCCKVLVFPEQISKDIDEQLVYNSWVLVRCYPNMMGPGQDGGLIDNDVENDSNIVDIFLYGFKFNKREDPFEKMINEKKRTEEQNS